MGTIVWAAAFIVGMVGGGCGVTLLLVLLIPRLPEWAAGPWALFSGLVGIVAAYFIAKVFLPSEAARRGLGP